MKGKHVQMNNFVYFFLAITGSSLSNPTYVRFSTLPATTITDRLYLPSKDFVYSMFSSMVRMCVKITYCMYLLETCSNGSNILSIDSQCIDD